MAESESKDFFISYNKADRGWAEWIAWQLEAEGYTTVLQAWDFRPGGNFIMQMDEATKRTKRTIAVLSPSYIASSFTQPEWATAFSQDPTGKQGKLLPVRVRNCELEGLLKQIVYIDLIGLNKIAASNTLRTGVLQSRARPNSEPLFPGDAPSPLPLAPSFPGEWPEVWSVPFLRNPFFTGRDDLLISLHELLATTRPTALTQARAISGLGGIGKTQTALEYAHRYRQEYRYVFWVSAATEEILLVEMVQLAAHLQVAGQDDQDQQKTVEALKQWLVRQHDWLLILDNADDLEMASKYLPQTNRIQGHVLLTTRASTGGAFVQIIDVEKMDKDEGVWLLLRRAHLLAADAALDGCNKQDRTDALAIVALLDGLPLAIDQAGAYIEETDITLTTYLSLYQTRRKDLLSQRGQLPPGHPETVATTWDLSFQHVEHMNPAAADLLRFCAFLAPDAIPETLFTQGVSTLEGHLATIAGDPIQFNAAIQMLRRYSLIRRSRETNTVSLHRLIQAVLQDAMSPDEQQTWAERAIRALSEVFPSVDSGTWRDAQPYLSHADIGLSLLDQYQISFQEAALFLHNYGLYFYYTAKYEQAEPLYQQALRISEIIEGPDHPSTGTTLHQLASLYQAQGKYEQAEPLYQRALRIKEGSVGPDHPSTGVTIYSLAGIYKDQKRYQEAELLYQRVLSIDTKHFGPEHMEVAIDLESYAHLLQKIGRLEEATQLQARAQAIRAKQQP